MDEQEVLGETPQVCLLLSSRAILPGAFQDQSVRSSEGSQVVVVATTGFSRVSPVPGRAGGVAWANQRLRNLHAFEPRLQC